MDEKNENDGEYTENTAEDIIISAEITGKYDDVISKLGEGSSEPDELRDLTADLATVFETVERTGGGTRSAIADQISGETAVEYDPEAVVDLMRILERYGLVALDGNTWRPADP